MKNDIFRKFIYLAAIQIILISQLLVITSVIISTPVLAESGSGSEGQTATEESSNSNNSGSGNADKPVSNETNGGEVTAPETPTEDTAGEAESITPPQTEEPVPATTTVTAGTNETATEDTAPVTEDAGGNQGMIQDAPGDTVNPGDVVAPEDAEEAAPAVAVTTEVAAQADTGPTTTLTIGATDNAKGATDTQNGFPVWYQDTTGTAVAPCLDGTDPNCVLPESGEEEGFDPNQPTQLGTNFPSEFFYWIAESEPLTTPNGGKTFVRTALEGAFLNEEPIPGDQMVFGRIRVTGTGLEPDSTYNVIHPYGEGTFQTDERGIIRRGIGTQDTGCFEAPCDFSLTFNSPVMESLLRWNTGAPAGYLGDAVTPHTVTGSPTDNNFFKITGPGLSGDGLLTDLFTVAGKLFNGELIADSSGVPVTEPPAVVGSSAVGDTDQTNGFPVSYQDANATAVAPCLDGTDPNCVLPESGEEEGFDPNQPTQLGTNFPSEFFYWIAESEPLTTPNGGKTFVRTALEGAFLNEEPIPGDQMVFGRIRVTGTGLEPNSSYTVTHPYGVDIYQTDELGIIRRAEGTEDVGCFSAPCTYAAALQSRIFQGFLRWDSGAPTGYLGDAVTPHTITGSPTGDNVFRIEGPGLGGEGLLTNLFTVAGKLLSNTLGTVADVVTGTLPAEESAITDPEVETDIAEPLIDTDLPGDLIPDAPDTEITLIDDILPEEESEDDDDELVLVSLPSGNTQDTLIGGQNTTPTIDTTNVGLGGTSTTGGQSTGNTNQQSNNESGVNSSGSTSGTSGNSEIEQRGSAAEGEIAGVDEEQIITENRVNQSSGNVLGIQDPAVSENQPIIDTEQTESSTVKTEISQPKGLNPLWITLAIVLLAIATGVSAWVPGTLKSRRHPRIKIG